VVAHMVAAAVTGVAAVQMSNASESATTATMTTVAIGTPAAMMPPVPVPSPALTEPAPLLLSVPEAAKLLGVSRAAMDKRIQRGQVPGVVRTGRRVQLLREKLVAGLERKAR